MIRYLSQHVEWSSSNEAEALSFIDAIVKSSLSAYTVDVLVDNVFVENIPDSLVKRVLFHIATSLVPTEVLSIIH